MKKFFEYTDKKITEKVFMQCLVMSVACILICIISLCSITYAWFTGSVASGNNMLKSGSFDLTLEVKKDGTDPVGLARESNGIWKGNFGEGTYTVKLTVTGESTANGRCSIIKVNGKDLETQINTVAMNSDNKELEFNLIVKKEAVIEFNPRWGIPVKEDINDGYTVTIDEIGNVKITSATTSTEVTVQ